MKKIYTFALALALAATATARTHVMTISLKDGSSQTINVADIDEMTFSEEGAEFTPAEAIAGEYTGTVTLAVGTLASYNVEIKPVITANADGSINFTYPQFDVPDTLMGNLTLGTVTINNIPYAEADGIFSLDYSAAGLKQHFTCVTPQGVTSMDSDYTIGEGSTIKIQATEDGIKVTNPFKLGSMPFPLTATFVGKK